MSILSKTRIVLLNTSHPGNIGATARAMKTMGLDALWLVSPKQFPHADATARASGADDLLAHATVCTHLQEALEDCNLVIGASARPRSIPCPILTPRECARLVAESGDNSRVAVLFGCEQSGLSNAEMDRCHYLVQVPANPDYGSLNLAAAVQIISYEFYVRHVKEHMPAGRPEHIPVSADEMERFYAHLEETLVALGFLDPENPRQLMRRLRRLYNRVQPDENEINILRGILTAARQGRE
ncbi:MAG: RNA methyltransferase [Gammaproteobacteria bacterium]|nr:MAG: RNA methyltransferase [Gammaproteobacteria bacterium]